MLSHQAAIFRSKRFQVSSGGLVLRRGLFLVEIWAASANVLLRKTEVDICVEGDGEKPWVAFLDYVKSHGTNKDTKELSKISGLAFLNEQDEMEFTGYGEPILGNENSFPDYDLLSKGLLSHPEMVKNYFREGKKSSWLQNDHRTYEPNRKPKLAGLWVSKGCVNRCTFCQRFCKGYRLFGLEKLDRHLAELKEKYDVQFIEIFDENFGSNKKHAYEVARIMKKYDMLWFSGGIRCTSFTLEDMKFMKECGCTGIKLGIESGSQKILDIMEKRFVIDDVYTALKNAHEVGTYAPLLFCIGMPGETDQTIKESGKFLAKIARMLGVSPIEVDFSATYAMPFPGASLYEYGQLQRVIGSSVDEEEEFLIFLTDKGASKTSYINLTGMSTKQVLFWDFLLIYEAMHAFYSNLAEKQKRQNSRNMSRSSLSLGERAARLFWKPITCLNEILIHSPLVAKMPRPLIYIPMRNLLYTEYKMHILFRHIMKYFGSEGKKIAENIDFQFKIEEKAKKCRPLTEVQSLRKINKKIRESRSAPQTLTEKNQQILYLGR